jgi:hypothetical protein
MVRSKPDRTLRKNLFYIGRVGTVNPLLLVFDEQNIDQSDVLQNKYYKREIVLTVATYSPFTIHH